MPASFARIAPATPLGPDPKNLARPCSDSSSSPPCFSFRCSPPRRSLRPKRTSEERSVRISSSPTGMRFSGYFRTLAAESPRVEVDVVGETTEGRDFLLATISSEANLERIDELRAKAARLADPRGLSAAEREELFASAKPIVFISIGMHSTETAAPQFGMEFAHRLATSDEEPYASAREELIVLIAPCLNPDGLDHVVSWVPRDSGNALRSDRSPQALSALRRARQQPRLVHAVAERDAHRHTALVFRVVSAGLLGRAPAGRLGGTLLRATLPRPSQPQPGPGDHCRYRPIGDARAVRHDARRFLGRLDRRHLRHVVERRQPQRAPCVTTSSGS